MTSAQITELRRIAERMRNVLESANSPRLANFPREKCNIACRLLARYVLEHTKIGPCAEVYGKRPDGKVGGHVWLQIGDVILDITADQFGQQPVIVARESAWHESLRKAESDDTLCDFGWRNRIIEADGDEAIYSYVVSEMTRIQ